MLFPPGSAFAAARGSILKVSAFRDFVHSPPGDAASSIAMTLRV